MEFPVRCFTCGNVIGQLYEQYKEMLNTTSAEGALDSLGIHRYCCRKMFVAHVDTVDTILRYPRV
ncbi:MAG: DNA-directed RNA polymerase subunit N [Candidatus Micrarchaeota archaeon]